MYLREAGLCARPDGPPDDSAGGVSAAHQPRHVRQGADLCALPALLYLLHGHPLDVLCYMIQLK